jgi:hypothetical protein
MYLKSKISAPLMRSVAVPPSNYARMDAAGNQSITASQLNDQATALITTRAIRMMQQISTQTVNPANQNVINIAPQNVGLVLGFLVEVNATLADPGAGNSYALSPFGPANAFSQIQFNDLSNVTRIQTTGWHLHSINSAKNGRPYLSARNNLNYPVGFGDTFGQNLAVNQANNIIQAAAQYDHTHFAQGVQMLYWVPMAYNALDLRGSYYANVVNASANLQLTINPSTSAFVANTGDPINAVYQAVGASTGGAWGTSFTVTVYQVYYDQLPIDTKSKQPILPYLSMSVIYDLKNVTYPAVTANNDFPISYANFRDFLSTTLIYDNPQSGVFGPPGADVNYWALRSANSLNIFKYTPKYTGVFSRAILGDDFPSQCYYFDSRTKPISTLAFGNMQMILNAAVAFGTPQVLAGFEAFSYQNTIAAASSLNTGT